MKGNREGPAILKWQTSGDCARKRSGKFGGTGRWPVLFCYLPYQPGVLEIAAVNTRVRFYFFVACICLHKKVHDHCTKINRTKEYTLSRLPSHPCPCICFQIPLMVFFCAISFLPILLEQFFAYISICITVLFLTLRSIWKCVFP